MSRVMWPGPMAIPKHAGPRDQPGGCGPRSGQEDISPPASPPRSLAPSLMRSSENAQTKASMEGQRDGEEQPGLLCSGALLSAT